MIEIGKQYKTVSAIPENNGLIVTVTGYLGWVGGWDSRDGPRWHINLELIDCHGDISNHFGENKLIPLYDGNEKIRWEEMQDIWTPERESA